MTVRAAVAAGLLVFGGAAIGAQNAAPIPENYYAAGENVDVPAPVLGDAVVAGRIVTIDQRVSGDILAARQGGFDARFLCRIMYLMAN